MNTSQLPLSLRPLDPSQCHALLQRLPVGIRPQKVLANLDRELRCHGIARPNISFEISNAASTSQNAQQRRARELLAPLQGAGELVVRAVLMQWSDENADLLLTASRASIGEIDLSALAKTVIHKDLSAPWAIPRVITDLEALPKGFAADTLPRFEWGLPYGTGMHVRTQVNNAAFPPDTPPICKVAAIGLAIARFERRSRVTIPIFWQAVRGPIMLGNVNQVKLLEIDLDNAADVKTLISSIESQLADGPLVDLLSVATLSKIGIVGPQFSLADDGATYIAHLKAPFPVTLFVPVDDNANGYRIDADGEILGMDMARTFSKVVFGFARELRDASKYTSSVLLNDIKWLDADHAAEVVALGSTRGLANNSLPGRIDERIAQRAHKHPDHVAITCEGANLTYRSLHDLSGRIATALADMGVHEGHFVAVIMDRCLDLVPVLLAVMRCGGIYVPLDPTYPVDRIAYTLADARPLVIVGNCPAGIESDSRWITPESLLRLANSATARPLLNARGADGSAYVIYTSGSTGRPKGVLVPHRNVCALIDATQSDFELEGSDVWTLFHSTAFDFSVWEIWASLSTGARLVVVPYWCARAPSSFRDLLIAEGVTVLNQTPSAFSQLIEAECSEGVQSLLSLRLVIFGGEALDCRMLTRWFDKYPESECRVVNMFGITETTVHVTAEDISRGHSLTRSRAVGKPISGWHVHILDDAQRLLPPGLIGEIYVAGDGVATGYLNRDDLTADRFINNPFTGGKMYRSGDLGRLRHDGRLEHFGRIDSQIKLRGFRIELDEIRSVLLECPGVGAAAVIVNRLDPEDAATARIDAYVVTSGASPSEVRRYAERMLPSHMVPATVTSIPELPLTTNGKVDLARLPNPIRSGTLRSCDPGHEQMLRTKTESAPLPPSRGHSSDLEGALAAVWSEVLGVDVNVDDNFFELGGNSLYVVKLSAAMRRRGLPVLPLRELYVHQTVRRIALALDADGAGVTVR